MWLSNSAAAKSWTSGLSCIRFLFAFLVIGVSLAIGYERPTWSDQAQPTKPKTRRVWTNEDLAEVRKPWDLYQIERDRRAEKERAARAAEEASKKTAAGLPSAATTPGTGVTEEKVEAPETVPALEQRITEVRVRVEELERKLKKVEQDALNAIEEERAAAQDQTQPIAKELEQARAELKLLEDKLISLKPSAKSSPLSP